MLSFLVAAFVIELTPGPNMTWLAVLGATRGRNSALAAVAGIALGLTLAGLVSALGLTVLFENFPGMFTTLRVAGTIYLFYLAYVAWTDASKPEAISAKPNSAFFQQGFISNALNPKAYLFYAAILPQFLTIPELQSQQLALFTAGYVAVATFIHTMIALLAGSVSEWLQNSPSARTLRRGMAVVIAVAAVWFFISTGNLK
jgi:threonine/homoserine/homoserine lactone efflux protein